MSIGGCENSITVVGGNISTIILTDCPIKHSSDLIWSTQFKMWCSHSSDCKFSNNKCRRCTTVSS